MTEVERITDALEKPLLDDRSYRVIRLKNKLEALLVHDPDSDKASASVNVQVGNFSDDDAMPGMAHAVEHLLFMGTEKASNSIKLWTSDTANILQYPVENAYNQYLSTHSGSSNAYTASTETNYYFEVAAQAETSDMKPDEGPSTNGNVEPPLYGALDRFAQFFIAPLFLDKTLDRELKAVDSENKKNLQSDNWRLSQLHKSLSNPKHPYHHFSTGNLQTLRDEPQKRGVEIRKEFMKFHEKHYSANRMKLVVLGRESLDQLESWVSELFADVKNKDLPQNRWDEEQPFSEEDMSTQVFARPVMQSRSLEMYFQYQDEELMYETQPSRYLSHMIGHEGPGSILSYIKAKGWANGLSAGAMPVCPGAAFFTISVKLTPDGLEHYQEVAKVIFQYISLLKESPPLKWAFEEMRVMSEVDFRFKQKTPAGRFTSKLSSVMQHPYPREWLLNGSSVLRRFDSTAITKAMEYLRADNFRMVIVSQDYPGGWDKREKWYGTEYKVEKIPAKFAEGIEKALKSESKDRLPDLHLPHKNEFIPTRLTVEKKEVAEPAKAPKLIRHDDSVRLWWKKDDTFWVPKGTVNITIRNPLVYATPANYVKTKLYCELVKDALVEYSYDAEISGLDYGLGATLFGLDVDVSGYNDKMAVLLEKVLTSMRNLEVKPDRFQIIKERLTRGFRNWDYQQPFHQVGEYMRWLGSAKSWINEQYTAELVDLEPLDISSFFPQILRQSHFEIIAHGNLYKEDALRMTSLVESTLRSRPLPQSQWHVRRNLIFPPGSDYIFPATLKDPANINHCIEYFLYVGQNHEKNLRAKLLLFAQMTEEPAFDQLRTKEQLGYVVFSGPRMAATTMGYRVIIQSERDCAYLESRIIAFLNRFGPTLKNVSDEEFEGHRRSLINKRLEKLKNLSQETGRLWNHIGSEYFDFYQVDTDVAALRQLSKADIVDFYNYFINPHSSTRAKLSVHMTAQSAAKKVESPPEQQTETFMTLLEGFFTSMQVESQPEKLEARFKDVDVSKGDRVSIVSALQVFLTEDVKLPAERINGIIETGEKAIGMIFQKLGISPTAQSANGEVDGDGAGNEVNGEVEKKSTVITNVHEFQSGLEVTRGPVPVTDLSEFEELEAKL
jgi:insulysin